MDPSRSFTSGGRLCPVDKRIQAIDYQIQVKESTLRHLKKRLVELGRLTSSSSSLTNQNQAANDQYNQLQEEFTAVESQLSQLKTEKASILGIQTVTSTAGSDVVSTSILATTSTPVSTSSTGTNSPRFFPTGSNSKKYRSSAFPRNWFRN